jgi:ribosome maturation factor RimP
MKQRIVEQVRALVEPLVEGSDLEIVDIEFRKEGRVHRLLVTIDRPGGVGIDDCVWLSERLSPVLDVEDPIPVRYVLEVSSPGVNRPLRRPADYERFTGERINVRFHRPWRGRKSWIGVLRGLRGEEIALELPTGELMCIPLDRVAACNLEFDFGGGAGGRRERAGGGVLHE